MTNTVNINELPDNDFRKTLPRYQQQHQENNQKLAQSFASLALQKGCTPAQLALAWLLAKGENIIPIPGTKKRDKLKDNAGSVDVQLTEKDLDNIEEVLAKFPNTGDRYNESNYRWVDKN
jgi:aryl-alcohol dehydrogenase-like predicted oxidoreductase